TGISGVQPARTALQAVDAAAGYSHRCAFNFHYGAERFHAAERAMTIGSGGEVAKLRGAFGQRGQHRVAVRNGFVSRPPDARGERFGRMNRLFAQASNFSTAGLALEPQTPVPPDSFGDALGRSALKHDTAALRIIEAGD